MQEKAAALELSREQFGRGSGQLERASPKSDQRTPVASTMTATSGLLIARRTRHKCDERCHLSNDGCRDACRPGSDGRPEPCDPGNGDLLDTRVRPIGILRVERDRRSDAGPEGGRPGSDGRPGSCGPGSGGRCLTFGCIHELGLSGADHCYCDSAGENRCHPHDRLGQESDQLAPITLPMRLRP